MSSDNASWSNLRRQMPSAAQMAYFDHAAVSPLPDPCCEAISAWLREASQLGAAAWGGWAKRLQRIRQTAASLIGAAAKEIALIPNTTTGVALVAEGFAWTSGDNVVTLANEFPSNLFPWMHLASRGVEVRRVAVDEARVDLNRIAEACDKRTRIVAVSWVGFASGWRLDVAQAARVAHDAGALFFLDAIQGMGVFPLDVGAAGVDFLAADGHKWMMGPEGAGLFYCRAEHLDLLRPLIVGWNSVAETGDYSDVPLVLRPNAARFEGGSQNMAGLLGLGANLDMLAGCGLSPAASPIADRVLALTDIACQRLESIGARIVSDREGAGRSGIVAFDLPGRDLAAQRRKCLANNVVLSLRAGNLRISPHAYNNEDDIERLINLLA